MPRKKTPKELDRDIDEILYGRPLPAAGAFVGRGVDTDADHPDDDRFDRVWKRQARKGRTDAFGSAEYKRTKGDWIADGSKIAAIADFIPSSTRR